MNPANQLLNKSNQIGRVNGRISRIVPVVCNDMRLTDVAAQIALRNMQFIIASFPLNGEPLIHAWGVKADNAWALAKHHRATPDAVLCARQPGDSPRWKSALGQEVTMEHITVRKEITQ
jgi:hypothetical protein